jgi:hypothetical protein
MLATVAQQRRATSEDKERFFAGRYERNCSRKSVTL